MRSRSRRVDERELEALETARFGDFRVGKGDVVFADGDGVLFAPGQRVGEVVLTARTIWRTEREQAAALGKGKKLRELLKFSEYLVKGSADPSYTFREHLRQIGGSIEE